MTVSIAIFFGVYIVLVVLAGWRGRRRRAFAVRIMRELLVGLVGPFPYRLPANEDGNLLRLLGTATTQERRLLDDGFRPLGELVYEAGPTIRAIVRVFVDAADDTTCAWLTVVALPVAGLRPPTLSLTSYSDEKEFVTLLQGEVRGAAKAPFVERQALGVDTPIADAKMKHRVFASRVAAHDALKHITDLASVFRESERRHSIYAEWRRTQPPDELLKSDLQGLLGSRYEKLGEKWIRMLTTGLPKAKVRRGG